jgi:hypothetical protein
MTTSRDARRLARDSASGRDGSAIFGEPLIDCEEDRTLRAVFVGMLREADNKPWR